MDRKKTLCIANFLLATAGAIAVLYIFTESLKPTIAIEKERTLTIDLRQIPQNSHRTLEWNGRAITIFRTGRESSEELVRANDLTAGPRYTANDVPEFFIYESTSPVKGCPLREIQKDNALTIEHQGWYDPCHMGAWDYAGRNILGALVPNNTILSNLKPLTKYIRRNGTIELRP